MDDASQGTARRRRFASPQRGGGSPRSEEGRAVATIEPAAARGAARPWQGWQLMAQGDPPGPGLRGGRSALERPARRRRVLLTVGFPPTATPPSEEASAQPRVRALGARVAVAPLPDGTRDPGRRRSRFAPAADGRTAGRRGGTARFDASWVRRRLAAAMRTFAPHPVRGGRAELTPPATSASQPWAIVPPSAEALRDDAARGRGRYDWDLIGERLLGSPGARHRVH